MGEIQVDRGWLERLDSVPHGRTFLWIGAVIVGIALFLGPTKGPAARIAPPATTLTPAGSPIPSDAGGYEPIYVHVAGAVVSPGLYALPEGSRVADAIEAAGGPTRRADLDVLNLAQVLLDGTKVEVFTPGSGSVSAPSATQPTSGAPISLNSADQAALETVPGIGPVRAAAIIAFREERGGFEAIEELLEVQGIGPTILASIRELVTL